MPDSTANILLISADQALHAGLKKALNEYEYRITAREETISAMNGTAHPLAASHDVVLFDTEASDDATMEAAKDICAHRQPGAMMIALANDDLPLSKQRILKRIGVDEVLPRDSVATDIPQQLDAWRARRSSHMPTIWTGQATEGKIISVAQARGGLGASTFAVNLADKLQNKKGTFKKTAGTEVAVVDLDFQFGSIAAQLDVNESDALWRMAMDGTIPDAAFVESAITKSEEGLSILTAPSRYGPLNAVKPEQIAALLDALRKSHDYIIVDLPHALVDWIEPVLSRSDRLMMTTDITVPSVRATRKLMDFFLAEHPDLAIELVAVHEKKPLVLGSHHRAAMELLERGFDHWLPTDARAARDALDRGKPLSVVSPRSSLSKAVGKVARSTSEVLPPRAIAH